MKILHIINSLATGGAEKLLLETLPLYKEKGLTTDLLLLNGTNHPFLAALKSLNCCQIYSLGTGSVYNPLHIFKIMAYLRKYEVVHVHLFPAQYFVVLAKLLSASKANLIFTEHSISNRRIRGNFLVRTVDMILYKRYKKIICITENIKNVLQNYTKMSPEKFEIIENGVNISTIKNAKPLHKNHLSAHVKEADKIIIQVSSFQEPKDQKTLIQAMALLAETYKLILVGIGPLKIETEELVTQLGLTERVFFLNSRMDVPQLLKTADVVVLSSKYEGLSLSSIEGMASGKPFVASNVPGLSEIVKGAGVLFPVGNEKKLAEELLRLTTNDEYYNQIVKQCLNRAKEFDIGKMIDQHISLYRSLL